MHNYRTIHDNFIKEVNNTLISEIVSGSPNEEVIEKSLQYGNRFRPLFVVLGFNMYEEIPSYNTTIVNIASAVECLHKATVILDDLIDEDDLRRGKVAFHKAYGANMTILTSSYLIAESYRLFTDAILELKPISTKNYLLKLYNETHYALFRGALYEQLNWPYTILLSTRINMNVTAVLIRNSLMFGYIMKDVCQEKKSFIASLVSQIGLTFQYINDARQFTCSEEEYQYKGKNYTDLIMKRNNLVLSILYDRLTRSEQDKYKEIVANISDDSKRVSIDWILKKLQDYKVLQLTESIVTKRKNRILLHLQHLPQTPSTEVLINLVNLINDSSFWDINKTKDLIYSNNDPK